MEKVVNDERTIFHKNGKNLTLGDIRECLEEIKDSPNELKVKLDSHYARMSGNIQTIKTIEVNSKAIIFKDL